MFTWGGQPVHLLYLEPVVWLMLRRLGYDVLHLGCLLLVVLMKLVGVSCCMSHRSGI
jgi:hypothetical protein